VSSEDGSTTERDPVNSAARQVVDQPREAALADRVTQLGRAALGSIVTASQQAVAGPDGHVGTAGRRAIGTPKQVDMKRTKLWAIAPDTGAGFLGSGIELFELVNRETGRAHTLNLVHLGISPPDVKSLLKNVGFSTGAGITSYTKFRTDRPVNFGDFEGCGARVTQASVVAASVVYLTLWEDTAYLSPRFLYVRMGGWGLSTPGAGFGHGVTTISYGDGKRSGPVELVLVLPPSDRPRAPRLASIRNAAMESPKIDIPNELLFDFDSVALQAEATEPLRYLAHLLNNRLEGPVDIEGHTDSIGAPEYNMKLSRRRAEAVKQWFVDEGVYDADEFRTHPYGETKPVSPNTNPDGSDNPEGRQENRRVTIRAAWNF
jgi:photosystem I P700 chlorophyll a apoprotein A2